MYTIDLMGFFKDCGCGCGGAKAQQKFLISLMSALVFFIISNPDTYRLTRAIFGRWVAGPTGCPSMRGLLLHTVVFVLITWAMMNIKKEGYAVAEDTVALAPSPEKVVEAPPPMAEVPEPLPGFSEPQYDMFDSGAQLASLDVFGGEIDTPAAIIKEASSDVSCQCSDGSAVTISK
jgi:hypothetical protein